MTLFSSFRLGIRSSGGYFVSTFLFGVMFGMTAGAVGIETWLGMVMSASVFSASAQFAALEFWQAPLPMATIALSVFLVSTRNILLSMSMANHFDGHGIGRRVALMFILNDPGVVTSFSQPPEVDRLGYVSGYGVALMLSWTSATLLGFALSGWVVNADFGSVAFAGPLVMATMMVLFVKGSRARPAPWVVSGAVSWLALETGAAPWQILALAVAAGVAVAIVQARLSDD
ncbi:AzlC family ABC transporter permease [Gammaproteobacteria bacterium]|nr:AzlC family ABC transporter permease [Gammaproteobacteria bacterium]